MILNLFAFPFALGAACGMAEIARQLRSGPEEKTEEAAPGDSDSIKFEELVKRQVTVDVLDGRTLSDCMKRLGKKSGDGLFFIAAKPAKRIQRKFMLTGFPEDMDTEHNLLLILMEEKTGRLREMQLVSFGAARRGMWEKMFGKDDFYIIGGD